MTEKIEPIVVFICMVLICTAFITGNFIWLRINQSPGFDDTAQFGIKALTYLDTGHMDDEYYPPLGMYLMALGNKISGRRDEIGSLCVIMPLSVIVLMIGMYIFGKKLGSPLIGVVSMMLIMSIPAVFHSSRQALLEFPETALLCLCLSLVTLSDFYRERTYAVLAGFAAGLGMLTKQTFILYVLFPFIVSVAYGLFLHKQQKKQIFINMLLAAVACTALAAVWYIPRTCRLMKVYVNIAYFGNTALYAPSVISVGSFLYYWGVLKVYLNPFWIALFILSGIVTVLVLKEKRGIILVSLAAIIGSYVLFTLMCSRHGKNLIPCVPYVVLIVTLGLSSIPQKYVRSGLLGVLTVSAFLQYFLVGYGTVISPWLNKALYPITVRQGPNLWRPYIPVENDEILNILLDIMKDKRITTSVTISTIAGNYSYTELRTAVQKVVQVYRLPLKNVYSEQTLTLDPQKYYDYVIAYEKAIIPSTYHMMKKYGSSLHEIDFNDTSVYLYKNANKNNKPRIDGMISK